MKHIYYGWTNLIVAALAMVATLPGRTQGLGLVDKRFKPRAGGRRGRGWA